MHKYTKKEDISLGSYFILKDTPTDTRMVCKVIAYRDKVLSDIDIVVKVLYPVSFYGITLSFKTYELLNKDITILQTNPIISILYD